MSNLDQNDFQRMLHEDIASANLGVTHDDFVTGVKCGQMGFKCMTGEPVQFVKGGRAIVFRVLVLLYLAAPPILIPIWAYHERNWWLLATILVSYAASISAAWRSKIVIYFLVLCIGAWFWIGFSLHHFLTFSCFCALWGYMLFEMAETAQRDYALQSLVERPDVFEDAISRNKIMIVRKPAALGE